MENTEASNYNKFKWISPFCHITGLLAVLTGPFLFPIIFWKFLTIVIIYGILRLAYMLVCGLIVIYRTLRIKTFQENENPTDVHYAWVIPNYMEGIDVITATLQQLATHTRAKNNYIICLAMEAHQVGATEKAKLMCEKFRLSFKIITFTLHTLIKNESKGKASNVSFAVEKFEQILPSQINLDKLMVTIMDCDSMCPKQYPDQVNEYLYKNPNEVYNVVFNPLQIFKRNDLDVPIFTRSFDNYHAFGHCNNSVSLLDISSPFSNYTLSYNLIKEVGFWDKNGEALGEDMHTFAKIFWKTEGRAKSIPIYTPFNQLNLETPDSYIENVKGKWKQTLRHSYGVHEVSYNVFEFSKTKVKTLKGLCLIYYFMDIMLIHNCFTTPVLFCYQLTGLLNHTNPYYLAALPTLQICGTLGFILNCLCLWTFEVYKRHCNKKYYNGENESWFRFLEYIVFLTVGVFGFIYPTFLIASIKGFYQNIEYSVASKKIKVAKSQ